MRRFQEKLRFYDAFLVSFVYISMLPALIVKKETLMVQL